MTGGRLTAGTARLMVGTGTDVTPPANGMETSAERMAMEPIECTERAGAEIMAATEASGGW